VLLRHRSAGIQAEKRKEKKEKKKKKKKAAAKKRKKLILPLFAVGLFVGVV
jgi:hypothetical protein